MKLSKFSKNNKQEKANSSRQKSQVDFLDQA